MNTTFSLRNVLLALGALFLLFVLRRLANPLFTLAVPVLFVWLLLSWNHPSRAKALFGASASKGFVRAGLAGALLVCAFLSSATAPTRSEGEPSAPRLAQGDAQDAVSPPNSNPSPVAARVATPVGDRKAEERIRIADARVRLAQAAERKAKRAQEKLEQKQQQEDERREKREAKAEEKRLEAARLAAMPTATPVDPNHPEKDIFGYHKINATATVSRYGVEFVNNDTYDYEEVYVTLNPTLLGGFRCDYAPLQMQSGQKYFISFQRFFDGNSRRFSILDYKLTKIVLTCRTKYGDGSGTFVIAQDAM